MSSDLVTIELIDKLSDSSLGWGGGRKRERENYVQYYPLKQPFSHTVPYSTFLNLPLG